MSTELLERIIHHPRPKDWIRLRNDDMIAIIRIHTTEPLTVTVHVGERTKGPKEVSLSAWKRECTGFFSPLICEYGEAHATDDRTE